jgi:hypothetical protein
LEVVAGAFPASAYTGLLGRARQILLLSVLPRPAPDVETPLEAAAEARVQVVSRTAINRLLQSARIVIERTQVPVSGPPEPSKSQDTSEAGKQRQILALRARTILGLGRTAMLRIASESVSEAAACLPELEMAQSRYSLFDILSVGSRERTFQSVLEWLLDTDGSHGLGDRFLRDFLARVRIDPDGRLSDFGHPLRSVVIDEFEWPVPANAALARLDGKRADKLRCDILLLVPPIAIPIEVKVEAVESQYLQAHTGRTWAQCALYVEHLSLLKSVRQLSASERQIAESVLNAANARSMKGKPGRNVLRNCSKIVGVLVHFPGACLKDLEQDFEHGRDVRHMDWRDVASILSEHAREAEPDVTTILKGLVNAIWRFIPVGDVDVLNVAREIRWWKAQKWLLEKHPAKAIERSRAFMKQVRDRTKCCGPVSTTGESERRQCNG